MLQDLIRNWARQCPIPITTRFAPSPSGWLHLGHVLSAMYVWGIGRALNAKIILRIEDHDLSRARPEFEGAICEDLSWLGLIPDEGVASIHRPSIHRQSDHLHSYEDALTYLIDRDLVYACDCTRRQISSRAGELEEELFYDGYCRNRRLPIRDGLGLRLKVPKEQVDFIDGRKGHQVQEPFKQCGDWLLRDRNGNYTYNAAVTIDDIRDNITIIIRGEDLLHATGRQLQLRKLLGVENKPLFIHHPLILDGQEKLSKRKGALGIRELRHQGKLASDVWKLAMSSAGLPPCENVGEAQRYFESLFD